MGHGLTTVMVVAGAIIGSGTLFGCQTSPGDPLAAGGRAEALGGFQAYPNGMWDGMHTPAGKKANYKLRIRGGGAPPGCGTSSCTIRTCRFNTTKPQGGALIWQGSGLTLAGGGHWGQEQTLLDVPLPMYDGLGAAAQATAQANGCANGFQVCGGLGGNGGDGGGTNQVDIYCSFPPEGGMRDSCDLLDLNQTTFPHNPAGVPPAPGYDGVWIANVRCGGCVQLIDLPPGTTCTAQVPNPNRPGYVAIDDTAGGCAAHMGEVDINPDYYGD